MLLRYELLLKHDARRLTYLLSQVREAGEGCYGAGDQGRLAPRHLRQRVAREPVVQVTRGGSPLVYLNFVDGLEVDMVNSAPEVGALLMYDYYHGERRGEEGEEEQREEEEEQQGGNQEEREGNDYSILPELFAVASLSDE